jgi:hypothetical protein
MDTVANNIVPALLEPLASTALIIRVIRQKQRFSQDVNWRKHRKMVLQLVPVSALNITLILPLNIFTLAYLFGLPSSYGAQVDLYFYFLGYFFPLVIPFIFISSIPQVSKKLKSIFRCEQRSIPIVGTANVINRTNRQ